MKLLWVLVLLPWTGANASETSADKRVDPVRLGRDYNNVLSSGSLMHYIYRFTAGSNEHRLRALRIRSEVHGHNNLACPLRVTVESDPSALNWRIPISEEHIQYDIVERTLFVGGNSSTSQHEQLISIVLSTSSEREVNFTISLHEVKDFVILESKTEEKEVANVVAHSAKGRYIYEYMTSALRGEGGYPQKQTK